MNRTVGTSVPPPVINIKGLPVAFVGTSRIVDIGLSVMFDPRPQVFFGGSKDDKHFSRLW